MIRRLILKGACTLIPLWAAVSDAQMPATPADTLRVSLADCIARAEASGEEVRQAEADLASARAIYVQARASALPQVNLAGSYTRQLESVFRDTGPDAAPFEPDTTDSLAGRVRALEDALPTAWLSGLGDLFGATPFASENSWSATISVGQTLLDGGSLWNSIRAARHALRAAAQAKEDRVAEIVLRVREAYLGALLADRGVRIAELGLAQAESQLRRASLRYETGQASEFELLQSQVHHDNQLPFVAQAGSMRELAHLELARLANLPAQPLELTTPLLDDRALPADPAAVDTSGLVALALGSSGLEALAEAVQARGAAVAVAASGRWPGLSVFASFSEQAYPQGTFPVADDWKRDIRAGAQLSWSLFDGWRTQGLVQQAKAQRNQAEQTLRQTRELVRQGVLQSQWELRRVAADLNAHSRTVALARRAYELASLRYDEGAADLLEVADARIAFQMAQSHEARGRHDYFITLARLERYSGRPLFSGPVAALESRGAR